MSDACNSILVLILLGVLGVFYIWLLALIYLGVIYCYFVVYLGSVITTPTRPPFSQSPTVWVADGGDKGKFKISVQHLSGFRDPETFQHTHTHTHTYTYIHTHTCIHTRLQDKMADEANQQLESALDTLLSITEKSGNLGKDLKRDIVDS